MGRPKLSDSERKLRQQLRDMQREDLRSQEILFIIWEPLCYQEDLLIKLSSLGVPMFVGCVHDSDVLPSGSRKKAHRHCGVKYKNYKYIDTFYSELKSLFGTVSGTVIDFSSGEEKIVDGESCYCISYPQKVVGSFSGAVRYTKHLDNPDKHFYSEDPIGLIGLDVYEFLFSSGDEVSLICDINSYIVENDIFSPSHFITQCSIDHKSAFLSLYIRKRSYLINSIIAARARAHSEELYERLNKGR